MNNSFLKVSSIILGCLLLVASIPWLRDAFGSKQGSNTLASTATSINLSSFAENSVTAVNIKQKDKDAIVLEKQGDVWKIGPDDADADKVTSLFQAFSSLVPQEMVSKNEANFAKFGVTKEDGIRLEVRDASGGSSVFYVGTDSDVPQEFFIRKDGIKNTYSAKGTLRSLLTQGASYWKKSSEEKSGADTSTNTNISKESAK